MSVSVPLKWHGGKAYLAPRINALFPPHVHYVEPYAGGLAVMLAHSGEGRSECANDINVSLTNFWGVLQVETLFTSFLRKCQATPFSEVEYDAAMFGYFDTLDYPVMAAHQFFVQCRQSLSGRMDSFAPLSRTRIRRGMNEQASAWLSAIEGLPEVHARLKRVVILNHDAIDVIREQDGPKTLFYLDPPYLKTTRAAPDVYAHEMTSEQHVDMLAAAVECKGMVAISGYHSELYDERLSGWKKHAFDLPNNAAGGKTKRRMTECLWCNF